jgi:trigger factor
MPDSAAAAHANKITVTDGGPCLKKISIEIPGEAVAEKLRDSLDSLSSAAQLPGFRKGRVPRRLLEKRFGGSVQTEAKNALVSAAYQQAVQDHKLKVVGEPTSEQLAKAELVEGKPLTFELEVEVMPEFTLPKLDGIAVLRPIFEVPDALVDDEVNKLCINEGTLEQREAAEPGDYLTGHGIMVGKDGTEFYNINGAVVQIPPAGREGKGMILGVMVDDFSKQFGIPTPGQTATVKVKGPENHEVEGVRNADLTITFKVERIDRIIPAKIEHIVQRFGIETEQQLKDGIRNRLRQRSLVNQSVAMRQQVAKYLLENTTFDLPKRLTAHQSVRNLERRRMELMYRGHEAHVIEEHIAELRNASSMEAQMDLKLFFILGHAADELKIRVDENEINNRIAQLAFERNLRPEKLRQEIIARNQVGMIFQQVREHKTMDAILSKAQIADKSPEEFEAAMKAHSTAGKTA